MTTSQLIARLQRKDELTQLRALVDSVLTPAARRKLENAAKVETFAFIDTQRATVSVTHLCRRYLSVDRLSAD